MKDQDRIHHFQDGIPASPSLAAVCAAGILFAGITLGSFGIGASLVVQGHPCFALLVILCGARVRIRAVNRNA